MSFRQAPDLRVTQGDRLTPDEGIQVPGWEAFAAADRMLRASPRVGDAVMRAWAERTSATPPGVRPGIGEGRCLEARHDGVVLQRGRPPGGHGFRRPMLTAAAAACMVVVLGGLSWWWVALDDEATARPLVGTVPAIVEEPAAPVVATVPNLPMPQQGRRRLSAAYRAVAGIPDLPLVTLAADPPLEGELLQIVRMRVPREALQAFGLSGADPNLSAVVEVDVVVGDDGLPRDIRRVRPVAEVSEP